MYAIFSQSYVKHWKTVSFLVFLSDIQLKKDIWHMGLYCKNWEFILFFPHYGFAVMQAANGSHHEQNSLLFKVKHCMPIVDCLALWSVVHLSEQLSACRFMLQTWVPPNLPTVGEESSHHRSPVSWQTFRKKWYGIVSLRLFMEVIHNEMRCFDTTLVSKGYKRTVKGLNIFILLNK